MIRFLCRMPGLFSLCLLLTLGVCRAQAPAAPLPDRSKWSVSAYLLPTTQAGDYDLGLAPYPEQALTLTPRLSEIRAEVRDEGTLRTLPAKVARLPAPLPVPPIPDDAPKRDPDPAWTGLRWDASGLPPGLYTLRVILPVDAADSAGKPFSVPAPTASLLVYLTDPDGLRVARARYLGKRVWPTEALAFEGSGEAHPTFWFRWPTSFRIKSITRLSQPYVDLAMNGGAGSDVSNANADFVTHDPLRVVFDQPRRLQIAAEAVGEAKVPPPQAPFFADFADAWQMDRALHLAPPAAHPPRLRHGMTPEQVIAALGWPTQYGSLAQIKQRAWWRYDHLRPFYAAVSFSQGRLTGYDPGGHLP